MDGRGQNNELPNPRTPADSAPSSSAASAPLGLDMEDMDTLDMTLGDYFDEESSLNLRELQLFFLGDAVEEEIPVCEDDLFSCLDDVEAVDPTLLSTSTEFILPPLLTSSVEPAVAGTSRGATSSSNAVAPLSDALLSFWDPVPAPTLSSSDAVPGPSTATFSLSEAVPGPSTTTFSLGAVPGPSSGAPSTSNAVPPLSKALLSFWDPVPGPSRDAVSGPPRVLPSSLDAIPGRSRDTTSSLDAVPGPSRAVSSWLNSVPGPSRSAAPSLDAIPGPSRATTLFEAVPNPSMVASSSPDQELNLNSLSIGNSGAAQTEHGRNKEIRKEFNSLIESCQALEETHGFDRSMERLLTQNIGKGKELFEEMSGGPGDMHLAFLHTQMCSSMLRSKTMNIGSSSSTFKLETYLESVMDKCKPPGSEYTPRFAVKCLSSSSSGCCVTLNPMSVLVGVLERKSDTPLLNEQAKQQRLPARRRQFDDNAVALLPQHRQSTSSDGVTTQTTDHDSVSEGILEMLKAVCAKNSKGSINIFEFVLDKSSFAKTIEALFYVAFLVRDGEVCLFRKANELQHDYTISIKPEIRPPIDMIEDVQTENVEDVQTEKAEKKKKKKKKKKRPAERSQFILSFSAKQWRELCGMATGESVIADYVQQSLVRDAEPDDEITT